MINKFIPIFLKIPMPPEAHDWIEERGIFEGKLSEQERKDCFKLSKFLILNKEKEQLTPEDNQLLDSVEKILNDLLKRLKEIKGE
ncbi:hypothetical protein [Planktothrix agardhii]|uniref:hypothetical protein n=1 Tax=Planktothrix agardhii TaxID=1160 RepID=UPI001D0B6965|nr:hypothetical protein [Planktothrix agardhii]MCB8785908.1 hypothetical protein [Planktothrix agardhii 1025]MCF3612343.1 hypothetical protein [Planktothrix agardhii 1027]